MLRAHNQLQAHASSLRAHKGLHLRPFQHCKLHSHSSPAWLVRASRGNNQQQSPPAVEQSQQPQEEEQVAAERCSEEDNIYYEEREQDGPYYIADGEEGGEWVEGSHSTADTVVGQQQPAEDEMLETEEVEEPITLRSIVTDFPGFVRDTNLGKGAAFAGLLVLGSTFYIAFQRYWAAYTSPQATRSRQVSRNKQLVAELSALLPEARSQLTPGKIRSLCSRTKFTTAEVFRKYLWFTLRERTFDQTTVDDICALREACSLSDDDVAEALRERAQRIYDKYGTLMLNTEGMTPEGIERKATCQNLFRKLLFLTEYEPLVKQTGGAAVTADLRKIFGATDEDVDRLRIVSLYDVDLERAFTKSSEESSGEVLDSSSSPPTSLPESRQEEQPAPEEPGKKQ